MGIDILEEMENEGWNRESKPVNVAKALTPTIPNGGPFGVDFDPGDDESELIKESMKAKLMEPIQKEQLNNFKIEMQKIDFLEKAGKVAEVPYMEFVYISHIEKLHVDLLRMIDMIKPKLSPLIMDCDEKGVNKLLKNEVREIIRSVKKGQKEAAKSWKKDLKG